MALYVDDTWDDLEYEREEFYGYYSSIEIEDICPVPIGYSNLADFSGWDIYGDYEDYTPF